MGNVKILNQTPVTMAEVKDVLSKLQTKTGELNYRANKTLGYLQEFSKLSLSKSKELREKIESLNIPRLKEEHIVKIVDTLPKYPDEVKALLTGYTITITNDNAKKIADTVSSFS
ncbi:MAG: RNA polymerase Rpb4 family protein [Candidatus Woesearchaeota archaeon]